MTATELPDFIVAILLVLAFLLPLALGFTIVAPLLLIHVILKHWRLKRWKI